jgi:hypothetical protein
MTKESPRSDGGHGDVNDQSRTGKVSNNGSDISRLPVRSLVAALDHLDAAGFCCCWLAPADRRCKARWSR